MAFPTISVQPLYNRSPVFGDKFLENLETADPFHRGTSLLENSETAVPFHRGTKLLESLEPQSRFRGRKLLEKLETAVPFSGD